LAPPSWPSVSLPQPIDVEVGSAPDAGLTWNIQQTTEFENVPFSLEQQETTGAITATVTDTRGTRVGWALSISGTDFVGATTDDTFSISNLRLTPGAVQVVSGQRDPLPVANGFALSGTPQRLFVAANGSGNGRYSMIVAGTLTIPGATVVDTYGATLTVSLDAAP
jgi:hypothetical protein